MALGRALLKAAIVGTACAVWSRRADVAALASKVRARLRLEVERLARRMAQERVFGTLGRFKELQAVFAAIDLSVFDLLALRGPTSLADLVEDMGQDESGATVNADAVASLLDVLVQAGLVSRSKAGRRTVYANSAAAARLLCRSSAENALASAASLREVCSQWSELSEALRAAPMRTGEPQLERSLANVAPSPLDWVMHAYAARTHARTLTSRRPRIGMLDGL